MSIHRKRWKKEEKQAIVSYAKKEGFLEASRHFNVSHTSIYKWRDQLDQGIELNGSTSKDSTQVIKNLMYENKALKNLVADLSLKLQIKEELLKKSL
jgi:transposase-like protein